MSEESDEKSNDQLQLVIHHPQWHSRGQFINSIVIVNEFDFKTPELTELIVKLDERYNDKVKKDGTAMARKPRRVGFLLLSRPPAGAPDWAVDLNWKGKIRFFLFFLNSCQLIFFCCRCVQLNLHAATKHLNSLNSNCSQVTCIS